MIFITSFNRPQLLLRLLRELQGEDVIVFDDGSDYDATEMYRHCDYQRVGHYGKQGFWKIWQLMFDIAMQSKAEEFIFLQDDIYNVDLEGLRQVETPDKYALNLMDVGPDRGWSPKGYVDCIFKTNRKTLEVINWYMPPVSPTRWARRPNMSSGVGHKLSQAFYRKKIPMILPKKNYASHGDAESKMHPEIRPKEPLNCKTGE